VDRYYSDGVLFLACPSLGTASHVTGSQVNNKRGFCETRRVAAGDVDAIRDERNSHLVCLGGWRDGM
jgi:hypothetical protein